MDVERQKKPAADATPTKEFFVHMLTRDISLEDTILDLIDNCLDGVLRTIGTARRREDARPYDGFFARLHFDSDWFSIEDNCGGIDLEIAETEAFRLGRPPSERDKNLGTVGVYGIGMKRALFKVGREAIVTSRYSDTGEFEVVIPENWVALPDWSFDIKIVETPTLRQRGTRIMVAKLTAEAAESFKNPSFLDRLEKNISNTYALILRKGFSIQVARKDREMAVQPSDMFVYVPSDGAVEGISPYVLRGMIDDVNVSLSCGFYRPLATETEIDDEQESRRTQNNAGWTIICNDRVIVYQDRTMLTGWGSGDIPSFHNQFIAFAGTIEFDAANAKLLPLTTTKRGIDVGSRVYLKSREYMMKGTKYFTNFTNKWKGSEEATSRFFENSTKVLATEAPAKMTAAMHDVPRSGGSLRQATPELPMPPREKSTRRIVFTKPVDAINRASELLFGRTEKPGVVGEACFDYALENLQ